MTSSYRMHAFVFSRGDGAMRTPWAPWGKGGKQSCDMDQYTWCRWSVTAQTANRSLASFAN